MNCRRIDLLLSDHLEGFLTPRLSRAVTAHLDGCSRCRRRCHKLGAVGAELRRAEALCRPPALLDRALESWLSEREASRPAPRTARGERRATPSVSRSPIPCSGSRYWNRWAAAAVGAAVLAGAAMIAGSFHGPFSGKETPARHLNVTDATRPGGPQMAQGSPLAPSDGGRRREVVRQRPERSVKRDEVPRAIIISGRYPADHAPSIRPAPHAGRRRGRHAGAREARGSFPPPADDLAALNGDPLRADQRWRALPQDEWQRIEQRVRRNIHVRDDFVTIPFPRLASTSERQITQAVESYKREAAIVDPRLSREVTCAFKGTALSDVCEQLEQETGIQLSAGPSVADEKVTVFCEKLPLRDVMRELSRPFGYTWLRSRKEGGDYRYELVQDLKSQLLEEELRNRDRDAALLDLQKEIDRYRPYLGLSPDEALARSKTAPPEEKNLLENYAGWGWGPLQLYARLSSQEQAALRAGQTISFSGDPQRIARDGAEPLPPDLERGVLQSMRDVRVRRPGSQTSTGPVIGGAQNLPDGVAPASSPEANGFVVLRIAHSELGQFTFDGASGVTVGNYITVRGHDGDLGRGVSPAVRDPKNEIANARLANDPALQGRVTMAPRRDLTTTPLRAVPPPSLQGKGEPPGLVRDPSGEAMRLPSPSRGGAGGGVGSAPKVMTADVLEALHHASGMPIVADYYTHLYPQASVAVKGQSLFEALNHLADAMHLRWNKDGGTAAESTRFAGTRSWLQFRSASYYDDRLKEVPNRLLTRWAAARRQYDGLPLDDLIEMAQLSDAQLDSSSVGEGVKELWGLEEWSLAQNHDARPHLRYLAQLTPAQRQLAMSAAGLSFSQLSLAQQQGLIAHLGERLPSLGALAGATVRMEYTQPGWFRWPPFTMPGSAQPGLFGLARVRAPTRAAALSAARLLDAQVSEAQIAPTDLSLTVVYTLTDPRTGKTSEWGMRTHGDGALISW